MCVTFFVFKNDRTYLKNKYRLIILNNRDEYYHRKTKKLSWENAILAGRDLDSDARGTWFGINKYGNIGILLSITEPKLQKRTNPISRGSIVINYLKNNFSLKNYLNKLSDNSYYDLYDGFNFIGFERTINGNYEVGSITNRFEKNNKWDIKTPGVYGYGNSPYYQPFKKVIYGKSLFNNFIDSFDFENNSQEKLINELLNIGKNNQTCFPDNQIKVQTDFEHDGYKPLCSLFVEFPNKVNHYYGTRSHSILLIDKNDEVTFFEDRMVEFPINSKQAKWEKTIYKFNLNKSIKVAE